MLGAWGGGPGGFLLAVPPERVRSWPWSQRGPQVSQSHPKAVKDFFHERLCIRGSQSQVETLDSLGLPRWLGGKELSCQYK